jgi:hypothetical protein
MHGNNGYGTCEVSSSHEKISAKKYLQVNDGSDWDACLLARVVNDGDDLKGQPPNLILRRVNLLDVCAVCTLDDQGQELLVDLVHEVFGRRVIEGRRLHELEGVMQ